MISEITSDVKTNFGTYHPYSISFTPKIPSYTINPDFGDVTNYNSFIFNSHDISLLKQNHFAVKKDSFQTFGGYNNYKQFYDVYNICTWRGIPIFVTTDAVLHIYHVLFDRLLSDIEYQKLYQTLNLITETLIDSTQAIYNKALKPEVREASRLNLAYLYVAKKLLIGSGVIVPDIISAKVDSELVLISNHDGYNYSPILGYFSKLDYSQFQVRGHYIKNDTLKAYFMTMMWYGWTIFTMEPDLFGEISYRHTLQALMFTQLLFNSKTDNEILYNSWKKIYGDKFLSISPDSLANSTLLNSFMMEAQKLPEPKIPNWIYGDFIKYKGFRFMGQRFIPDSYMFAHLVLPEVSDRHFPKGLDILAILGSNRAFRHLDSLYKETSYPNYSAKINQFKTEFSQKPADEWAQNLYWNWLYCLMPLLYKKGEGYPVFMQTDTWNDKELMTSLASWTELRHDAILYSKQSTSPLGIAPGPPKNYVEPNPHLYARLVGLVRYTRDGLQNFNLLLDEYKDKLDLFEKLLIFLKDISIKELENIPLSDTEYENIYCFGKVMEDLVSTNIEPKYPWRKNSDDMAIIADVHTDANTNQCLEEGVGYPITIYVIVNEGGVKRITLGAMFSYYEFTQPISGRLTDETWREKIMTDKNLSMPEWATSFTEIKGSMAIFSLMSPHNLFGKDFLVNVNNNSSSELKNYQLLQNYPNPFNSSTIIEFMLPDPGYVTIKLYNVLGEEVATIINEQLNAGKHKIEWNGNKISSGIYFYKLIVNGASPSHTGNYIETRKLVLLK
jgi:flagellar hook assembly protein FlgD